MNNQLIGLEILSLAETDVPPEDLVFHRFYTNKTNSSNKQKKKKKKKAAGDEGAEELYAVDGDGDQSDNEEIENMLDSSNLSLEADGDYDYDDLDNIANEDDDDLIESDEELDLPSDVASGELEDADISSFEDDDGDDVGLGEADDGSDEEDNFDQRKRKGKSHKHASASPFASIEEYEHLINDGSPETKVSNKKKIPKTKKRRRTPK